MLKIVRGISLKKASIALLILSHMFRPLGLTFKDQNGERLMVQRAIEWETKFQ